MEIVMVQQPQRFAQHQLNFVRYMHQVALKYQIVKTKQLNIFISDIDAYQVNADQWTLIQVLFIKNISAFSTTVKNFNICNDSSIDITDESGFVSSPGYPTYTTVSTECTRRIRVPNNKIINVYVLSDQKSEDYSTNL